MEPETALAEQPRRSSEGGSRIGPREGGPGGAPAGARTAEKSKPGPDPGTEDLLAEVASPQWHRQTHLVEAAAQTVADAVFELLLLAGDGIALVLEVGCHDRDL